MKAKGGTTQTKRWLIVLGAFAILAMTALLFFDHQEEQILFAEYTSVEKTIPTKGYILRCETVLDSQVEGTVISEVAEGKKVCVGETVASLYTGSEAAAIRDKIIKKQTQIDELRATYQMLLSHDEASLDDYVKDALSVVVSNAEKGHCSTVFFVKPVFQTITSVSAGKSSAQADYESQMESLQAEKQNYIAQLGSRAKEIQAPVSGAYYQETDGYEEALHAKRVDEITISYLNEIEGEKSVPNTAGKIVDNFSYYLTGVVPSEKAEVFYIGKTVSLILQDGTEVSADVSHNTIEEGSCLLIFHITSQIPELMKKREISYTIVEHRYKGYMIPIEAVHVYHSGMDVDADVSVVEAAFSGEDVSGIVYKAYQTPNTFVYVRKTGVKTVRWVDIIYQTEEYAIVRDSMMYNNVRLDYGLELHDKIVVQ